MATSLAVVSAPKLKQPAAVTRRIMKAIMKGAPQFSRKYSLIMEVYFVFVVFFKAVLLTYTGVDLSLFYGKDKIMVKLSERDYDLKTALDTLIFLGLSELRINVMIFPLNSGAV